MKIESVKQSKKPKYAAAMAALLTAAGTLTGCTDGLALDGEATTVPEPVTEEVELAGDVEVIPDVTEELMLDGDLVMADE